MFKSSILLITALAISLIGCGNDDILPIVIPTPPPKKESVVPQLNKIEGGIDSTVSENVKIENKIEEQRKELSIQHLEILEAIAKAEYLENILLSNSPTSKSESINFIDRLKKIEARNLFIEKQNSELKKIQQDQLEILKNTKNDVVIAHAKLIDKEQEASNLRDQNDFLAKNLSSNLLEAERLKKNLENERIKSAKSSVYRNWVIGLISGFILWVVIKNILMIYFPMTKFRI